MSEPDLASQCEAAVGSDLKSRAAKDQKEHTEFVAVSERTYLVVTAIHKDQSRNIVNRISCKKVVPIGGYIYDSLSDTYQVECCDYLHLGYIPFSLMATVPNTGWRFRVPMCEATIKRFMTDLQKKELKNFKSHFKNSDYHIEFMQMIDAN